MSAARTAPVIRGMLWITVALAAGVGLATGPQSGAVDRPAVASYGHR